MPKPVAVWLETPKVRPAEGLMPGLLKLKPELLLLPKPRKSRKRGMQDKGEEENIENVREN